MIAHPQRQLIGESAAELPALTAARGVVYKNFSGELVSGAGTTVANLDWQIIAEWPRGETQELIRTIRWQIGGFSLLTLLVIALIASWVAFRLIQPIAELNQGTSVIGAGNFNYRVRIKTGDELEDLGANLNRMAKGLKGIEEVHELRLRTELLAESLKKEQELSKLKDQFITTVSHQFNTPLSVINWALASLNDAKLDAEKVRESAKIIAKSQRDIVAIVTDLMTLSEVGFRYEKTRAKPTDLAQLINKIIDTFLEITKIRKITMAFRVSTSNTAAPVNEFTIEKALANLIDNAIVYSNDGGRIDVELGGTDREITLRVTDQGIGIPKEDQPSIFREFFRAKNAIAKKNVGTGLGLFIAKNIIEGHGGKIWFASEENQGSTFYVKLPR